MQHPLFAMYSNGELPLPPIYAYPQVEKNIVPLGWAMWATGWERKSGHIILLYSTPSALLPLCTKKKLCMPEAQSLPKLSLGWDSNALSPARVCG